MPTRIVSMTSSFTLWILDSEVFIHMTCDCSLFINFHATQFMRLVSIGNGATASVHGLGSIVTLCPYVVSYCMMHYMFPMNMLFICSLIKSLYCLVTF